ncbi:30S ribosomal protein S20 [uncultured Sunxiuqinia sp.]|uniref:30S ribosomal protein S20 n=1 Tax=uncultured Sunxiuqinia sp. TaxID=1573825 RepID=UPI002AA8E3D3|nr:30S ribosomal protein S20 [uncultured Sunxiuqinia sp.]
MAHHQSAKKRIRQDEKKKVHNKYFTKTMRNAVRDLRAISEKDAAAVEYPKVVSMIDRLAKKNLIHKNKAANLKSKLAAHISKL